MITYYLDICKDEIQSKTIIDALKVQADYVIENVNDNAKPIRKTSGLWGATNSYSILQPIVRLYKLTGEKRYLDYATAIIRDMDCDGMNLFKVAFEDKFAPYDYSVNKAYEVMSCFEGALDYYLVTGEEKVLVAVRNFALAVLKTDFTLIGGLGCKGEQYDNSTRRQVIPSPNEMQETCVTVTLIKFLTELYVVTGDVKLINAIERSFMNLYCGVVNFEHKKNKFPIFLSYSPILYAPRWKFIGGVKKIDKYNKFGCCISIGAAGIGMLPKVSAVTKDNAIYLNWFTDAEYLGDINGKAVKVKVSGGYPDNGKVKIALENLPKNGVSLYLRKPDWCDKFNLDRDFTENDGYLKVDISSDCQVVYDLDIPIKYVLSESVNPCVDYRVAITKGPIVLCQDDADGDQPVDFDFKSVCAEKVVAENGKVQYLLNIKGGKKITLSKYCDAGKKEINKTVLNVWFRFK